jgi:hypothetical protein
MSIQLEDQAILNYIATARADGWVDHTEHKTGGDMTWLMKDGWSLCAIMARGEASGAITIWAPDQLQIIPPREYNWMEIGRQTRYCEYCKSADVDTVRIGFAGRCCATCRPKLAKILEKFGWCN